MTLPEQRRKTLRKFAAQRSLQAVAIAGILYIFVFSYLPMFGIVIAFKNYRFEPGFLGIMRAPWVGGKYFYEFFTDFEFVRVVRNTILLSLIKIIFTFPAPILLALVLNEVRNQTAKRIVQTVSYLPYFISWTVVSAIMFSFFNTQDGLVNQILIRLHIIEDGIGFLIEPDYFRTMMTISDVWKNTGWWAIIFLAAISNVDMEQYEAAVIDGAGRLQRIWHITFPGIRGAVMVVLILSLGGLFGGGLGGSNFEQSYLLGNQVNRPVATIVQTYALEQGISKGRYPYATAIGLVQSVISLVLIFGSNYASKKMSGVSVF